MRKIALVAVAPTVLAVVIGCYGRYQASPVGPTPEQVAAAKAKLLQAEDPKSALTVVEAKSALAGGASKELTVAGVIGGMPNPFGQELRPDFPWVADEATFFLVDPATAAEFEGDHAHAPGEECPFCQAKAHDMVDTVAMVGLLNDKAVTYPYRVDQLLGLNEGTTVVVTGNATMLADVLVMEATGIHVREPEPADAENAEAEVVEP